MSELVAETHDPFLQTIVDVTIPRTLFGRVLLTGDAAFVVQPRTQRNRESGHEASALARALASAHQNVDVALRIHRAVAAGIREPPVRIWPGARQPLVQKEQPRSIGLLSERAREIAADRAAKYRMRPTDAA